MYALLVDHYHGHDGGAERSDLITSLEWSYGHIWTLLLPCDSCEKIRAWLQRHNVSYAADEINRQREAQYFALLFLDRREQRLILANVS